VINLSTKQQLRQQYLQKRQQLSVEEHVELNQKLLSQFQELDLTDIQCIHLFLPMKQNNEPDTYLILDWLKADHPHIRIVFPKTNFTALTMHSFADDAELQLAINKQGITEPVAGNEVKASELI
jgi:5-formyltetrahydrofolate cyclo-ligase